MGKTLASYTYQQNTGLMLSTTYGNGFTVAYSYDDLGRVTTVKYNGSTAYTYEYDGSDYLTYNHYDDLNRLSEQVMVYGYVGDDVNECK